MSRLLRPVVPGLPLHITQRGNNRESIFLDTSDHYLCSTLLLRASEKYKCSIHAYVLMSNHLHLLCTPDNEDGPARMMQSVGLSYVRYFNRRHKRTGTLWEGRYHSSLVDSSRYFFACSRYIELNPVRAQMVNHPREYAWSSYRHNIGSHTNPLVTTHHLYRELAKSDDKRALAYQAMFAHAIDDDVTTLIRNGTRTGNATGDSEFRIRIERSLRRPIARGQRGGDRRSRGYRMEMGLD